MFSFTSFSFFFFFSFRLQAQEEERVDLLLLVEKTKALGRQGNGSIGISVRSFLVKALDFGLRVLFPLG